MVQLHKLMVRDVAIDKRSIYLISPNKAGPEMYEVTCTSTSHRKRWKQLIEEAVQECPDEDEGVVEDEIFEEKKAAEARAAKIKKLLGKMTIFWAIFPLLLLKSLIFSLTSTPSSFLFQ